MLQITHTRAPARMHTHIWIYECHSSITEEIMENYFVEVIQPGRDYRNNRKQVEKTKINNSLIRFLQSVLQRFTSTYKLENSFTIQVFKKREKKNLKIIVGKTYSITIIRYINYMLHNWYENIKKKI